MEWFYLLLGALAKYLFQFLVVGVFFGIFYLIGYAFSKAAPKLDKELKGPPSQVRFRLILVFCALWSSWVS